MIEVTIHGTKGGFGLIYGEQRLFADPNADTTSWQSIGQTAYSLKFLNNSCVFSKYKIIRDVIGDKRQGSIAFSAIISYNQKLSGADVKSLIDRISDEYCQKYIEGNNLGNIREDWSFINTIVASYKNKLNSKSYVNEMLSGTQEPAIIYYNSDIELQEYFDKPYQDEYNNFKEIFLISSVLKNKDENPLNSLRNSNIELKDIDLTNESFYLNNYNRSKGVNITANGKLRSEGKGNNQIRAKWKVEIKYSKDYYKPIIATGSISNPASDIHKYLEINGSNIKIKYDAFLPDPETKTITFNVVTKKDGVKVTDAEIQVDTQPWQSLSNVTFVAEELSREHKIAARKGDNLFSDVVKITPKDYSEVSIPLPLIEKRVVKITATDQENGTAIWQFKVHITGKDFYKVTDQIEFVGDEIDREWNIQIEKSKEYSDSENKKFCPAKDGKEINFKLKKNKKQPNESSNHRHSSHYSLDKEKKQKSVFDKITPKKWGFIGVGFLVLAFCIWALYLLFGKDKQPKEIPLNKLKIEMYVESDSLLLDKLKTYKVNWEKQEQNFITKSGGGMFGGDENVDSTKWKNDWKPAYESIGRAIKKRELINNKNIAELRNQRYSNGQLSFKAAIEKIDSTKYAEVGVELGDVSALTLTQIAEKINEILKPKETAKDEKPEEEKSVNGKKNEPDNITTYLKSSSDFQLDSINKYYAVSGLSTELNQSLKLIRTFLNNNCKNCETFKKNTSNDKFLKENQNLESWVNTVCNDSPSITNNQTHASINETPEIIQYIKGSELDKAKLKAYKNTKSISKKLKNSIQLCLDFWALDDCRDCIPKRTYWTFLPQINKDSNLQESKLKEFLDKMCQEGVKQKYTDSDKIRGLR